MRAPDRGFWAGRRVLLTGHTGFKGAWAARMLAALGAKVTGLALDPGTPSAFRALGVAGVLERDLRIDLSTASPALPACDLALHFAAQAIVSEGYRDPAGTWAANLTGTLHLLSALREAPCPAVIVTSDKVYRNDAARAFVESDPLGGDDPYSASKAAVEILVASHRASFGLQLATARAGNVIGGGDFGRDRLVPDLVRAGQAGRPLVLRNLSATRPFQHVLDVVTGYLLLAEDLAAGKAPPAVNFGPAEAEISVAELLALWAEVAGPLDWHAPPAPPMPEKSRLALDSSLARAALGWAPRFSTRAAVADTARWYGLWAAGHDMGSEAYAALAAALEG